MYSFLRETRLILFDSKNRFDRRTKIESNDSIPQFRGIDFDAVIIFAINIALKNNHHTQNMLSASAVDGIWRACLFKLSKLLPLDASRRRRRRRKKNEEETKTAIDVRSTSDDDEDDENDSQYHSDDEDIDDLTVYLRYLAILDRLNLCERSCVHPQKHRLIDRLMSLAYFRVSTLRREIEHEEDEEIFETETVDERLRHRNEAKESGEMVVPERFRRERRRFLMEEVTRVVEKARADLASSAIIETAKDDASEEEKKADEEEKMDETSDMEKDGEEETNVTEMEECEEEEEEEEEEEVKEKRASSVEYADAHRKAVVHMQRHARGCLARKKMRRKAEEELERLGMLVPSDERRMKSGKTKMNICVDSSGSTAAAAAGSENEGEEEKEDIETKIERTRNERLREYLQNQPRVYEQTKKALLEEHSRESVLALETFVREYRETHEGAAPEWKDIVNDAESNTDDAVSHRSVLYLLEATENSESENDENDDDRRCGFEALRKILAESERAFPSTRIDDYIDDEIDEKAQERRRDENNRERRCTHFSERAEKSAIEKKILKEVSMEIKENVKLVLDEMRAKDASSSSPSTRSEEGGNAKTKKAVATKKEKNNNKKKNNANEEVEDEKKNKKKNKKTDKKSIKAKKCSSASSAAAQRETALYDSIDAYPITKYLLESNVQIDATCETNNEKYEKFIASGADEFAYGVPEEDEAVKSDRSIDDQRRAIESIKSNVLIPLGASGASDVWMESFRAMKPKHLLFVGPRGCGQKHFAKNVLARETGSVFFDASIESVSRRMKMTTDNENDDDINNISDSALRFKDHDDNGKDEEIAFCTDLLKQTFQLAKKWAPSVVYVGNIEDAFATGKRKKKKKSTKTKTKAKGSAKTNEKDEKEEEEEKINTDSVAIAKNGTDGRMQRERAPARRLKKIDPKSFKSALTAALKSLEKENSCSRRVCVVASISDASRLTKKDEKSLLGKIFHPKDAFVAPFMRPSRAARYDLLKTFYREIADEYTETFERCNASSMKKSKTSRVLVADGARDEGAVSELSHFSETCNRKVLKLCVREGFRKAAEYIVSSSSSFSSSSSSSPSSSISSSNNSSAKSLNRDDCIIQPRAFTDGQRALVWRFASEHLRTLREETQKRIVEEEEEEEKDEARDDDIASKEESSHFSLFFFANEENDAILRVFAKRVCSSSSSSSLSRRRRR